MANEELIRRWLKGELSEDERRNFEESDEFAGIRHLDQALGSFRAPEYDAEKEYQELYNNVISGGKTRSISDRLRPLARLAAVLLIMLTVGYFSYSYFFAPGKNWISEQTEIYLPDSSFIQLNKGSKIRYAEKNWDEQRDVELRGEAFFRVKEGSQFNVITPLGKVTVLGTEFNVRSWDDYYEVTCYSGSVRVKAEEHSVVLEANSVFKLSGGNENLYTIPETPEPSWMKGESTFRSVALTHVFNELERQYDLTIQAKNVDQSKLFTGSFPHNNLILALESVTVPLNLQYDIRDNIVVIAREEN